MKALSLRWMRMRSSTSSGLIAVAVERLEGEPASVDLAALAHGFGQLIVEVLMPGESLVAEARESALDPERDAGSVEQHRGVEALALQPGRLEEVDETDRALEGDGMESDERFLAGFGFDVLEHLLFVVDQIVARLMGWLRHGWHGRPLIAGAGGRRRRREVP